MWDKAPFLGHYYLGFIDELEVVLETINNVGADDTNMGLKGSNVEDFSIKLNPTVFLRTPQNLLLINAQKHFTTKIPFMIQGFLNV